MRRRIAHVLMLCCLGLAAACQLQEPPVSTNPTAAPANPAGAPTTANAPTEVAIAPTAAATPAVTSAPLPPIELAPIPARIPASFRDPAMQGFADFRLPRVRSEGRIQALSTAPDLSNVELTTLLSQAQQELLAKQGFVVSPGDTKEFFEVYERARYQFIPAFVTSDSVLHVYHLLFDKTLRRTEMMFLSDMVARLDWELLRESARQYEQLHDTPWAEAARRNMAYFALAVKVLNPDWTEPEIVHDLVAADLQQIEAHSGPGKSAIFPAYPQGEDWSQYVPRGHYTANDVLKRYFVAMMWHGRMTFRVADPTETQQAALLALAYSQATVEGQPVRTLWSGIYEPTTFFVGRSDDLMPSDYEQVLTAAYGTLSGPRDLLDAAKFAQFQAAARDLPPPEVLGMLLPDRKLDAEQVTKGLRFMGQRVVPDATVFNQLIDDRVTGRSLPKGLDFFAALGSERALEHLADTGDTAMPNYQQQMDKVRTLFKGYDEQVWTQNLYWSWIYSMLPLLDRPDQGYPQFMRSEAWLDKQLNTALGSWTELKRDTILYAKQSYAEGAAGALPPPAPEPPKGYVEPVPLLYARVVALTDMTIAGLDQRGLLDPADKQALDAMLQLVDRLRALAEKELNNEALTDDDYTFIREYGKALETLTFAAHDDETSYANQAGAIAADPLQAAVVADVATDPGGHVLEEGVGRVFDIYVVAPIAGRLVLTRGGVFSQYEFAQPIGDRLTDEAWQKMLEDGKAPPLNAWTSSYLVHQTFEQPLAERIRQFNDALVAAFWYTNPDLVKSFLGQAELDDTRAFIQDLKAKGEFLGMKRHSLQYLSFDFQDASHATVATRERWSEESYTGSPNFDSPEAPVKVGVRPPYDLMATYTIELQGDTWIITHIETQADLPPLQQP